MELRSAFASAARLGRRLLTETAVVSGLLALLSASPSRAAIDAPLNTSNFVSGQASELSIDGVITSGGPSTSITGAALTISFDPADVSLSGLRAGTGWSLQNTNTDNLSQGWVKAVLSNTENNGAGQTTTGPILYFTVTPANGQVDPDDCGTLRFAGVDSDLSDQEYVTVYPSDPCEGQMAPMGREEPASDRRGTDPTTLLDEVTWTGCTGEVANALRIAAGLASASDEDMDALDRNLDEQIDIVDAVMLARTPCSLVPRGWYTHQGNRRRTGRSPWPLRPNAELAWPQAVSLEAYALQVLAPGVLAVPDPDQPTGYPLLFVTGTDGTGSTNVYRVRDRGQGLAPLTTHDQTLPTGAQGEPSTFEAIGAPVLYNDRLWVAGNAGYGPFGSAYIYVLNAADLTLADLAGQENPISLGTASSVFAAPGATPETTDWQPGMVLSVNKTIGEVAGGYLVCFCAEDGRELWSTSSRTPYFSELGQGNPDNSLPAASYGAPSLCDAHLYVGTGFGYVEKRAVSDGESDRAVASDLSVPCSDASIVSAVTAFNGHVYSTAVDDSLESSSNRFGFAASFPSAFTGIPDPEVGLCESLSAEWYQYQLFTPVWASTAIDREYRYPVEPTATTGSVIAVDDGHPLANPPTVRAFWADRVVSQPEPYLMWEQELGIATSARCSPVVAMAPESTDRYAYVPVDDGTSTYVYVLNAVTGSAPPTPTPAYLGGVALTGQIRSGIAVYRARTVWVGCIC